MTHGHHLLTEKEKQALRLLGLGHDAKSIARHLELSVHTINERLRDSRRKLATSSSREAARLLREIEGPPPEKPVHNDFGDAAGIRDAPDIMHQAKAAASWRTPGWIIGGLTMAIALAVLAFAALSAPETAPIAAPAATASQNETIAAARQFMALIDANNWDASWDMTGKSFKSLNTSAKWAEVSTVVRAQYGRNKGRELLSAGWVPAPPSGYWIVKFRAHYANQADAIETLSLERDNGQWRVVGVTLE